MQLRWQETIFLYLERSEGGVGFFYFFYFLGFIAALCQLRGANVCCCDKDGEKNSSRIWKKAKCLQARKNQNVTFQEIRHANMYNSIKAFTIIKSYYQSSKVLPNTDWDESGRGPQAL